MNLEKMISYLHYFSRLAAWTIVIAYLKAAISTTDILRFEILQIIKSISNKQYSA